MGAVLAGIVDEVLGTSNLMEMVLGVLVGLLISGLFRFCIL